MWQLIRPKGKRRSVFKNLRDYVNQSVIKKKEATETHINYIDAYEPLSSTY